MFLPSSVQMSIKRRGYGTQCNTLDTIKSWDAGHGGDYGL
jgi:hypothetical protein